METVQIERGFTDDERARVADLYWDAFAGKVAPAFRDEVDGHRVVRSGLRGDRMLVARIDAQVVGVCGFYEGGIGVLDLPWKRLRGLLPLVQTLRAAVVLGVLSPSESPGVFCLDGICVDATRRGAGVGGALLAAADGQARASGARAVRLTVIDRNPRAAALYRRRGFVPVDGGSLGVLSVVYGFDRFTVMEKNVTP